MRKYILALILGIGIVFQGQSVYAQVEDVDSKNSYTTQTIDKNILADEELMKTITPEQLEEYIAQGADVNAKDIMGFTALMYAVADKDHKLNIIETLLKNGADVNAKSNDGYTPLLAAMHGENPETIVLLLERGANFNEIGDYLTILFAVSAMEEPKPQIIKTLIKKGANVNARDKNAYTALIFIYHNCSGKYPVQEGVELLLKYGADINARDKNGMTALAHSIGRYCSDDSIQLLINKGANINTKDKFGYTPLLLAAKYRKLQIIQMLLDNGAKIEDANELLDLLDKNEYIEKNQDYWDLRDRIYNASTE